MMLSPQGSFSVRVVCRGAAEPVAENRVAARRAAGTEVCFFMVLDALLCADEEGA